MLKQNFASAVIEKFKNKFFFIKSYYDTDTINEEALKLEFEKYNIEIPQDKIENL